MAKLINSGGDGHIPGGNKPLIGLPYAYTESGKVVKTKTYKVSFRKQNTNELKKGMINITGGQLKGVLDTFHGYGWGLVRIKEITGETL